MGELIPQHSPAIIPRGVVLGILGQQFRDLLQCVKAVFMFGHLLRVRAFVSLSFKV